MKLWTLCSDRKRWSNKWTLSRSDSMGNVVNKLENQDDPIISLVEYPDDFLDRFEYIFEKYGYHIKTRETYDNDDYDISETSISECISALKPREGIVISDGVPVGHMVTSMEYGHGMDNRSWTYGTILFFDKPDEQAGEHFMQSYSVSNQSGRWSTSSTYTIVDKSDPDVMK